MKKTPAKKVIKTAVSPKAKKVRRASRAKKPSPKAHVEKTGLFNLLVPPGSHKKRKYLGRGSSSGHGKTSTRGSKGQTSRAGRHFYLGFEGGQTPLIRRVPKRGFVSNFRKEYQIVNLVELGKIKDSLITLEIMEQKGLIKDKGKLVKILGEGEVKTSFTVQAHAVSKSAAQKLKNAGGKIEIVSPANHS